MSTRIHNGYRIVAGTDPFDLLDLIRDTLLPTFRRLHTEALAAGVARLLDNAALGLRHPVQHPLSDVAAQLRVAWVERRHLDLELALLRDPHNRDLYALIYDHSPEQAYTAQLERLDPIEPYHYWNNVDPDEAVADDEWTERGKVWDRTVGYRSPAEIGLSWRLLPAGPDYLAALRSQDVDDRRAAVLAALPDRTARARQAAVDLVEADPARWMPGYAGREIPTTEWFELLEATGERAAELAPSIEPQLTELDDLHLKGVVQPAKIEVNP